MNAGKHAAQCSVTIWHLRGHRSQGQMSLQWHVGVCHSQVLSASTNICRTAEGVCHGHIAEEVEGHVVALVQDVPAAVQCKFSERQDVKYVVHVTVAVALSALGRQSCVRKVAESSKTYVTRWLT